MSAFWKKYKIKIIILAYIVAIFSLIRFVTVPFVGKIKEKSDSIQERIINSRISEIRIGEIPDMEETLENYQNNSKALEVILNIEKEVDFIKRVESIADATGNRITLSVENSNVNQNKKNAPAGKEKTIKDSLKYSTYVPMDINLNGDYPSLVNFINKLENSDYYVNIISIRSEKVTEEVSSQSEEVPVGDIFSVPVSFENANPGPQEIKNKREILNSEIKIIIYTEE